MSDVSVMGLGPMGRALVRARLDGGHRPSRRCTHAAGWTAHRSSWACSAGARAATRVYPPHEMVNWDEIRDVYIEHFVSLADARAVRAASCEGPKGSRRWVLFIVVPRRAHSPHSSARERR